MKTITTLVLLLLPTFAWSATDCRLIEYPERYEAICVGDAPPASGKLNIGERKNTVSDLSANGSRRGRLEQSTMEKSRAERLATIIAERQKNGLH